MIPFPFVVELALLAAGPAHPSHAFASDSPRTECARCGRHRGSLAASVQCLGERT